MKQAQYQSSSSPYHRFIKQESEMFYQASLLFPEDKHLISWALFAFWKSLTPFELWQDSDGPQRFIKKWKQTIVFSEAWEQDLTISQNAWLDLQERFNPSCKELILNLLNGLESSSGTIRFPVFSDLEFYLKYVGGSIALSSAYILFFDEIQNGNHEFLEAIYQLGAAFLWWQLLQETPLLAQEGRLFVPLEDLKNYNCSEEDLLAHNKTKSIVELTKYELDRAAELLRVVKRNSTNFPKGLKEALTFISNQMTEQIHSAIRSGWTLASKEAPGKKPIRASWFINSVTKLASNKANTTP